jgi:hypothetical protein
MFASNTIKLAMVEQEELTQRTNRQPSVWTGR